MKGMRNHRPVHVILGTPTTPTTKSISLAITEKANKSKVNIFSDHDGQHINGHMHRSDSSNNINNDMPPPPPPLQTPMRTHQNQHNQSQDYQHHPLQGARYPEGLKVIGGGITTIIDPSLSSSSASASTPTHSTPTHSTPTHSTPTHSNPTPAPELFQQHLHHHHNKRRHIYPRMNQYQHLLDQNEQHPCQHQQYQNDQQDHHQQNQNDQQDHYQQDQDHQQDQNQEHHHPQKQKQKQQQQYGDTVNNTATTEATMTTVTTRSPSLSVSSPCVESFLFSSFPASLPRVITKSGNSCGTNSGNSNVNSNGNGHGHDHGHSNDSGNENINGNRNGNGNGDGNGNHKRNGNVIGYLCSNGSNTTSGGNGIEKSGDGDNKEERGDDEMMIDDNGGLATHYHQNHQQDHHYYPNAGNDTHNSTHHHGSSYNFSTSRETHVSSMSNLSMDYHLNINHHGCSNSFRCDDDNDIPTGGIDRYPHQSQDSSPWLSPVYFLSSVAAEGGLGREDKATRMTMGTLSPIHTKLFNFDNDDDNNEVDSRQQRGKLKDDGEDRTSSSKSIGFGAVDNEITTADGRIRLNFSSLLSPSGFQSDPPGSHDRSSNDRDGIERDDHHDNGFDSMHTNIIKRRKDENKNRNKSKKSETNYGTGHSRDNVNNDSDDDMSGYYDSETGEFFGSKHHIDLQRNDDTNDERIIVVNRVEDITKKHPRLEAIIGASTSLHQKQQEQQLGGPQSNDFLSLSNDCATVNNSKHSHTLLSQTHHPDEVVDRNDHVASFTPFKHALNDRSIDIGISVENESAMNRVDETNNDTSCYHSGDNQCDYQRHEQEQDSHKHQPPPMTPQEARFRFSLDSTQCSPIASIPDGVGNSILMPGSIIDVSHNIQTKIVADSSTKVVSTDDVRLLKNDIDINNRERGIVLGKERNNRDGSNSDDYSDDFLRLPTAFSSVGSKSGNKENELWKTPACSITSASSSASYTTRKNRPMPDISAFDVGSSATLSTLIMQNHDSGDAAINQSGTVSSGSGNSGESDKGGVGQQHQQLQISSPPKLLCPPTPIRTPAWVHNGNFTQHKDSLNTCKILAACPSRILDGLSFLENSFLEDEKSGYTGTHDVTEKSNKAKPLSFSFSAVPEEDENSGSSSENYIKKNDSDDDNNTAIFENRMNLDTDGKEGNQQQKHNSELECDHHSDADTESLHCVLFNDQQEFESTTNASFSSKLPVLEANPTTPWTNSASQFQTPVALNSKIEIEDNNHCTPVSFQQDFENLGQLGSGTFADVFKARLKLDGNLYAIKRIRTQFRGKRHRARIMREVRTMQQLQSSHPPSCKVDEISHCNRDKFDADDSSNDNSKNGKNAKNLYRLYLLKFIRAWQEDGHFFSQTELCCRHNCKEMMMSLTVNWRNTRLVYPSLNRNLLSFTAPPSNNNCSIIDGTIKNECTSSHPLVPESTIWKICQNIAAGLCHIHSQKFVHHDIKPLNIFFVPHYKLGVLCKIGDFGMAGYVGTAEDGQEGDTAYMPQELLSSAIKHPSGDIFSLGMTLYELALSGTRDFPSDGGRWHEIRSAIHVPELPPTRSKKLGDLIRQMIKPDNTKRPTANEILNDNSRVLQAGIENDIFLQDYINDVQEFDHAQEEKHALALFQANQNRDSTDPAIERSWNVQTPTNFNLVHSNKGSSLF